MRIELLRPGQDLDWRVLEAEWRALEAAADASFFQSWTWVGCLAASRYADPVVARASSQGGIGTGGVGDGRVLGLALFNRTGPPLARSLRLHETGRPGQDSVFIEHNGPLLARGRGDLLQPMLAAALRQGRLVLSGVGDEVLAAASGLGRCRVVTTRPAPYAVLGRSGDEWLAGLGAPTRAHLRRSRRRYEAAGRLVVQRAADVAEGLAFLDALAVLHQARWVARGRPGAFAEPAFLAFHRALVASGLPRGEVELSRVSSVGQSARHVLGYLYNFRRDGRVYAYQGGFDYAAAGPHQAPGLTCHHAAIEAAIASGARIYDFLAGEARYKTSLGGSEARMHWLELTAPGTIHDFARRLRRPAAAMPRRA